MIKKYFLSTELFELFDKAEDIKSLVKLFSFSKESQLNEFVDKKKISDHDMNLFYRISRSSDLLYNKHISAIKGRVKIDSKPVSETKTITEPSIEDINAAREKMYGSKKVTAKVSQKKMSMPQIVKSKEPILRHIGEGIVNINDFTIGMSSDTNAIPDVLITKDGESVEDQAVGQGFEIPPADQDAFFKGRLHWKKQKVLNISSLNWKHPDVFEALLMANDGSLEEFLDTYRPLNSPYMRLVCGFVEDLYEYSQEMPDEE